MSEQNPGLRHGLSFAIKLMLSVAFLGCLYVFVCGISGPSETFVQAEFGDVLIGQTAPRRLGRQAVWVTRLSEEQRDEAQQLQGWLSEPETGCQPSVELCILNRPGQRNGIDTVFSDQKPDQLPADVPWFGGFVDPATGAVFDRLGRAYQVNESSDSMSVAPKDEQSD